MLHYFKVTLAAFTGRTITFFHTSSLVTNQIQNIIYLFYYVDKTIFTHSHNLGSLELNKFLLQRLITHFIIFKYLFIIFKQIICIH